MTLKNSPKWPGNAGNYLELNELNERKFIHLYWRKDNKERFRPGPPDWKNNTEKKHKKYSTKKTTEKNHTDRETGASRQFRAPLGPLGPLQNSIVLKGFRKALNWAPIISKDSGCNFFLSFLKTYIYTYTFFKTYIRIYNYICMYILLDIYVYVRIHFAWHIHANIHLEIHIRIYIYAYIHLARRIRIHIYTFGKTYIRYQEYRL